MRRGSRPRRGEQGQVMVEFAFVLPIVLLLVVGLIEFGKAFNYWLSLNDLASEGARWAAVDLVPAYPPDLDDASNSPTVDELQGYVLSRIGSSELLTLVEENDENLEICFVSSGTPSPTGLPSAGDAVMVRVSADYDLGIIGRVVSLFSSDSSGFGTIRLNGTSWTRLEQAPSTTDANPGWVECPG